MTTPAERIRAAIRDIPDFPKPGILFKDITPVLGDPALFRAAADWCAESCRSLGADKIAAVESRGFLFGAAAAYALGVGLVPVRKKGKLPYETVGEKYALEYGEAEIEVHRDALSPGDRVVLLDDVLATGGTAAASARLLERLGARVAGVIFVVELAFLNGRAPLAGREVRSMVTYA